MAQKMVSINNRAVAVDVPDEGTVGFINGFADGAAAQKSGLEIHPSVTANPLNDYRRGYLEGYNQAG